jgi:diaminopropionate ammonia-lyase
MFDLVINESRLRGTAEHTLLFDFDRAFEEIASWPEYSPTPLLDLSSLARRHRVRNVLYKDEGRRLGGSSFKMLGGAYAVANILRRLQRPATFVAATGGNHGASVTWAARRSNCDCVLYVPAGVSSERKSHLARLGARVIQIDGTYDEAVALARASALQNDWVLVGDTSTSDKDPIVVDVMAGYGVLARELVAQLADDSRTATHIFIPCGVGGLVAAVVAYFQSVAGPYAPMVISCEPEGAASVLSSIRSGLLDDLSRVRSSFSCLACARPSAVAWNVLSKGLDAAVAIPDEKIRAAQNVLRAECNIEAGETAGAGIAALMSVGDDEHARNLLSIDTQSVIVVIGTEGQNATVTSYGPPGLYVL